MRTYRIVVVPRGEVRTGYHPFRLEVGALRYPAPSEDLHLQYLRTGESETLGLGRGGIEEARLEDYVVGGLVDFDDVAYDEHADLLYDLAAQVVAHFRGYLAEDDARRVLRVHQREIARHVHAQMQQHYWEDAAGYDVRVSKGFTELKPSAYAAAAGDAVLDYRHAPADKSRMAKCLFGHFARCLYPVQKFHSDAERRLAVVLEREAEKWFRPARGQFQLFYRRGADHPEYQPDFVAETAGHIYMIEPKARDEMQDAEVQAKRDVAVQWCAHATAHTATHGGKPWSYLLVPHDEIAENVTLAGLARQFTER